MSRLSKRTIKLPEGISVAKADGEVIFKGPKGERRLRIMPAVDVFVVGDSVLVKPIADCREGKINSGTMWSLVNNSITGVRDGFIKTLEMEGIGYRASLDGQTLVLSLGYVNPVRYLPSEDVSIAVEKNIIRVSGLDKDAVGRAAAEIRSLKKPEPYKGKGIRYQGEVIRRKVGKRAAGVTAAA